MTRLITFATDNMTIAAEICRESALSNNVQEATIYGMGDIDEDFKKANKEIFASKRGPAFWIWKPYLIDRELSQMKSGDILIYSDAGVEIVNNVNHVIDKMQDDIWLFGNMWEHQHWCKADVMQLVLGEPRINGRQVQASVIIIRNSLSARKFIADWLTFCQVFGMIDDSYSTIPNHPEFREHRHDQAILTCLAMREKINPQWWPAIYNAGSFEYDSVHYYKVYPVLFHHHRMRNEQFTATDDLNRHMQNYFKRKYKVAT